MMEEKVAPPLQTPLATIHRAAGAELRELDGWLVPARYGDRLAEYQAVRGGSAGLLDLCAGGRIEVRGAEAEAFLNGLVTNDVKKLDQGAWLLAAFPNVQGRLIAFVRIIRLDQRTFLLDAEAATRDRVRQMLERYTLAGDFHVQDVTDRCARLSVQGAGASQVIAAIFGTSAARLERWRTAQIDWKGARALLLRDTHTGEDGFDIFIETERAPDLWRALQKGGARPIGFEALETLRIEAGIPRHGIDMDETVIVLETGLDHAVSFTKGCYLGQEIIARIHWRGQVAKKLMGLVLQDEPNDAERSALPKATLIAPDGREMGRITSSAHSPQLQRTVALAYVRYAYLEPGTRARIVLPGREIEAHVAALPLVRGGWFVED